MVFVFFLYVGVGFCLPVMVVSLCLSVSVGNLIELVFNS